MKNRLGEVGFNRYGSRMEIIEYNNYDSIVVEFKQGYRVHTSYGKFKNGGVRSVYDHTVCSIGYIGEGEYKVSIDRVHTPYYTYWKRMLNRGYSQKWKEKYPTYMVNVLLLMNGIISKLLLSGAMKIIMR